MKTLREKLRGVVEPGSCTLPGKIYDTFMVSVILLSLLPLVLKDTTPFLAWLDWAVVAVFILDYLLRFFSTFRYPFTFMGIIDLLSILPSLLLLSADELKLFRLLRFLRAMEIFRVFKLLRYSQNGATLIRVIKKQKTALLLFLSLAVSYIFLCALLLFNIEPGTFDDFFEAVYWAAMSLTTVGYGDICPVTAAGRAITMLSSLMGIAVISLPAGILAAGYITEVTRPSKEASK